jgi:transposase
MSTRPHRVRTWGRRGQTPILRELFSWKRISLIAGITWRQFFFRVHERSIKSAQVVEFLRALLRHLPGRLLVIWDGATIHRSAEVKEFLGRQGRRLWVERLPAYAPELNPVEYLWGHLKEHEVGNLLVRHGHELSPKATAALRRMRRRPSLIAACWKQSELWP